MEKDKDLNIVMDAGTISKNKASSKSPLSGGKQLLSKLGIIIPTVIITVICTIGLMRYALADNATERLTMEPINSNENIMVETATPNPTESEILGTNVVAQICILVRDIETTAKVYGEFFGVRYRISESVPYETAKTVYNGEPSPARCKMAFFELGSVQLELIQPDEHPSVWREDLDRNGEGFHHIAFKVKDTENVLAKMEGMGMRKRMTGNWATGCFAYVDAYAQLKVLIETLEDGHLLKGEW